MPISLFGPKRYFDCREVGDSKLRAAAEFIDHKVGSKHDFQVSEKDLKQAEGLLDKHHAAVKAGKPEKSPFFDPHSRTIELEIDNLEAALPTLRGFLSTKKEQQYTGPFCTSIRYDAIRDKQLHACANVVANCFCKGNDEINFSELRCAIEKFDAYQDGSLAKADPDTARRIDAFKEQHGADALQAFDKDNLSRIEMYMLTGKGAIVNHGPFTINGVKYHDVFPLPIPADVTTTEGGLSGAIDDFETRFKGCGHDRIYIKDDNGHVYVALNAKGSLDHVQPTYRVQMGGSDNTHDKYCDSATVVRVVDEPNSLKEATIGFWGKLVKRVSNLFYNKLITSADRRIDQATSDAVDAIANASPADAQKKLDLKQLVTTGVLTAGFGVATFNLPAALAVIGGTGGVVTVANVVKYLTTNRDKMPIYHAIGVNINRDWKLTY